MSRGSVRLYFGTVVGFQKEQAMKRLNGMAKNSALLSAFVGLCVSFGCVNVWAQAASETDVAQSMGVGLQSRFASGAKPIELTRTEIVPGTPMTVNSTMNNIMASNRGNSFGGILARYDTTNFGKFFGSGTLAPHTNSSRVDALENLTQADADIENVETERMYPPRLWIDFNLLPTRSLSSPDVRTGLGSQITNVLARFDIDPSVENVDFRTEGSTVYLVGKVKYAREAELLKNVISLQGGVNKVVSELEILNPEVRDVNIYGLPSKSN